MNNKKIVIVGFCIIFVAPIVADSFSLVPIVHVTYSASGFLNFVDEYIVTSILFYTFFKKGTNPDCIDMNCVKYSNCKMKKLEEEICES